MKAATRKSGVNQFVIRVGDHRFSQSVTASGKFEVNNTVNMYIFAKYLHDFMSEVFIRMKLNPGTRGGRIDPQSIDTTNTKYVFLVSTLAVIGSIQNKWIHQ